METGLREAEEGFWFANSPKRLSEANPSSPTSENQGVRQNLAPFYFLRLQHGCNIQYSNLLRDKNN
jgi:hypothetical protein